MNLKDTDPVVIRSVSLGTNKVEQVISVSSSAIKIEVVHREIGVHEMAVAEKILLRMIEINVPMPADDMVKVSFDIAEKFTGMARERGHLVKLATTDEMNPVIGEMIIDLTRVING